MKPIDKHNWNIIKKHLITNDPIMDLLIRRYGKPGLLNKEIQINLFDRLVSSIISQQLSVLAARSIKSKLYQLMQASEFKPHQFFEISTKQLKTCGLSQSKSSYIKSLALILNKNPDFLTNLQTLNNEIVIKKLTAIKGIGPWTAQMFLMFALKRLDVFAPQDVGLIRGIRTIYSAPIETIIEQITKKWKPYRTIGSWYMWQVIDSQPLSKKN